MKEARHGRNNRFYLIPLLIMLVVGALMVAGPQASLRLPPGYWDFFRATESPCQQHGEQDTIALCKMLVIGFCFGGGWVIAGFFMAISLLVAQM